MSDTGNNSQSGDGDAIFHRFLSTIRNLATNEEQEVELRINLARLVTFPRGLVQQICAAAIADNMPGIQRALATNNRINIVDIAGLCTVPDEGTRVFLASRLDLGPQHCDLLYRPPQGISLSWAVLAKLAGNPRTPAALLTRLIASDIDFDQDEQFEVVAALVGNPNVPPDLMQFYLSTLSPAEAERLRPICISSKTTNNELRTYLICQAPEEEVIHLANRNMVEERIIRRWLEAGYFGRPAKTFLAARKLQQKIADFDKMCPPHRIKPDPEWERLSYEERFAPLIPDNFSPEYPGQMPPCRFPEAFYLQYKNRRKREILFDADHLDDRLAKHKERIANLVNEKKIADAKRADAEKKQKEAKALGMPATAESTSSRDPNVPRSPASTGGTGANQTAAPPASATYSQILNSLPKDKDKPPSSPTNPNGKS